MFEVPNCACRCVAITLCSCRDDHKCVLKTLPRAKQTASCQMNMHSFFVLLFLLWGTVDVSVSQNGKRFFSRPYFEFLKLEGCAVDTRVCVEALIPPEASDVVTQCDFATYCIL